MAPDARSREVGSEVERHFGRRGQGHVVGPLGEHIGRQRNLPRCDEHLPERSQHRPLSVSLHGRLVLDVRHDIREFLIGHALEIDRRHGGGPAVGQNTVAHDPIPVGGGVLDRATPHARRDVRPEERPDGKGVDHDASTEVLSVAVGACITGFQQVLSPLHRQRDRLGLGLLDDRILRPTAGCEHHGKHRDREADRMTA